MSATRISGSHTVPAQPTKATFQPPPKAGAVPEQQRELQRMAARTAGAYLTVMASGTECDAADTPLLVCADIVIV